MYVFGGLRNATVYTNQLHMFNKVELTWKEIMSTAIEPRKDHVSVIHPKGDALWIHGGLGPKHVFADLWAINLETFKWSKVAVRGKKPPPMWGHTAVVHNDHMWVFGGMSGEWRACRECGRPSQCARRPPHPTFPSPQPVSRRGAADCGCARLAAPASAPACARRARHGPVLTR